MIQDLKVQEVKLQIILRNLESIITHPNRNRLDSIIIEYVVLKRNDINKVLANSQTISRGNIIELVEYQIHINKIWIDSLHVESINILKSLNT